MVLSERRRRPAGSWTRLWPRREEAGRGAGSEPRPAHRAGRQPEGSPGAGPAERGRRGCGAPSAGGTCPLSTAAQRGLHRDHGLGARGHSWRPRGSLLAGPRGPGRGRAPCTHPFRGRPEKVPGESGPTGGAARTGAEPRPPELRRRLAPGSSRLFPRRGYRPGRLRSCDRGRRRAGAELTEGASSRRGSEASGPLGKPCALSLQGRVEAKDGETLLVAPGERGAPFGAASPEAAGGR